MCARLRLDDLLTPCSVQEGLIFVAMSAEELLSGTSTYRLQHRSHSPSASPSPRRGGRIHNEEQISLREAIDDPDVWQHARRRMQDDNEARTERLLLRTRRLNPHSPPPAQADHQMQGDVEARIERLRLRTRRLNPNFPPPAHADRQRTPEPLVDSDEDVDFDCDYTASAGVSAPTPPPFNVTTTSEEEEESANDDYPNVETMADRIQREGRWRPSSDDEDEDVVSRRGTGARFRQLLETAQFADDYEMRSRRIAIGPRYRNLLDNTQPIRASRLVRPSRIDAGADDAERGDVLAPHARFFIKKHRNKITIKFEPAM